MSVRRGLFTRNGRQITNKKAGITTEAPLYDINLNTETVFVAAREPDLECR